MKLRPFICTLGLLLVISSCSYAQNKVQIAKKAGQAFMESNEKAPFAVSEGTKIAREALSREGAAAVRGVVTTGQEFLELQSKPEWFKAELGSGEKIKFLKVADVPTRTLDQSFNPTHQTSANGAANPEGLANKLPKVVLEDSRALMSQAAASGDLETVKALFESGAKVRDVWDALRLMNASLPHPQVVEYFCQISDPWLTKVTSGSKLQIFAQDASRDGHWETVRVLLNHIPEQEPKLVLEKILNNALNQEQFEIADGLVRDFDFGFSVNYTLQGYLKFEDRYGMLTESKLTWLLDHMKISDNMFINYYGGENSPLRIQAFSAFKKDRSLPAQFGMTPVDFTKKCYTENTDGSFYQMLQERGIINL